MANKLIFQLTSGVQRGIMCLSTGIAIFLYIIELMRGKYLFRLFP
jgi:hypothetical protein